MYDFDHMLPANPPLPDELRELLPPALHANCVTRCYAKGDRLFEIGKTPRSMFYISGGEVILERAGVSGDAVILQRSRQGLIAEASLQSRCYHCDALVVSDAQITLMPIKDLIHALRNDAEFALRWIAMLNREVKRLRLQCERLSLNTVAERLLHLLDTEAGPQGLPIVAGVKSLAREMGVTHEALYRCISTLEKKSVIERRDGFLVKC
jgi:CRP/FNR family transcriptional regulator, dissimilatory nitrate respiration regulator